MLIVRKARVPIPPRQKTNPTGMNKTEAEYALVLEAQKQAGEILDWGFEVLALKLADGCRYTPDFLVTFPDRMECHETKGFMRDDAAVKLKVVAERFWQVRFVLVKKAKPRGWTHTVIGPD
jgi:hypothetical protein